MYGLKSFVFWRSNGQLNVLFGVKRYEAWRSQFQDGGARAGMKHQGMLVPHGRALWELLEIFRSGVPGGKVENGQTSTMVMHINDFFFFFLALGKPQRSQKPWIRRISMST